MPPDSVRTADTKAWLSKSLMDIRAAAFELTADPPFAAHAAFHAQQAAEKALKAFLVWHDTPFRKTHDLMEIGRQSVDLDGSLATLLERASVLTPYAWKFRYPGEAQEPTASEAEAAIALAREVHDAIVARLPEELQP